MKTVGQVREAFTRHGKKDLLVSKLNSKSILLRKKFFLGERVLWRKL